MKSYGHHRRDKLQCRYGCCQLKRGTKFGSQRESADRSRRKTARQEATKSIFTSLLED